jgi:hypothetical protein
LLNGWPTQLARGVLQPCPLRDVVLAFGRDSAEGQPRQQPSQQPSPAKNEENRTSRIHAELWIFLVWANFMI